MNKKIYTITISGLFSALVLVMTLFAFPIANGYANLGDCFVILSGIVLGPVYGGISAGIGSFLSDLFLGYAVYAPATLIIKLLMAVCAGAIFKLIKNRFSVILCGLCAEAIMLAGYFLFDSMLYGVPAAFISFLGNGFQAAIGLAASVTLYYVLHYSKALDKISQNKI